jgi:hypothetical protein
MLMLNGCRICVHFPDGRISALGDGAAAARSLLCATVLLVGGAAAMCHKSKPGIDYAMRRMMASLRPEVTFKASSPSVTVDVYFLYNKYTQTLARLSKNTHTSARDCRAKYTESAMPKICA